MTMAMPQGNAVFPRSHVGFDSITQQIEKKLLKRGFQFNVICVGMTVAVRVKVRKRLTSTRANRSGKVNTDQHNLRFPPYRLQRQTTT